MREMRASQRVRKGGGGEKSKMRKERVEKEKETIRLEKEKTEVRANKGD